jgi:PAS domain S-box-containing protein
MNTVPVLIWSTDEAGHGVYFNKVWLDFVDRRLEDEIGQGWLSNLHPDDAAARRELTQLFRDRDRVRVEFRLRRADGAWRWMLCRGVPRIDPSGEFAGFVGSCTDTTDVKEAQAQRQHDLDEKAAVMQELHHRVKNNAQVFASLLSVQASRAADPAVKAALRVASARASTMAFAQQQIWDAGSSAQFDLGALVRRLVRAQLVRGIDVEVTAPDTMFVSLATAVPLGLIVHELLANALAHAFPQGPPGQVAITLVRDAEQRLLVVVADDGVGMPAEAEGRSGRSAGLTIVHSLVRQLGARLETLVSGGTTVSLRLPPPAAEANRLASGAGGAIVNAG